MVTFIEGCSCNFKSSLVDYLSTTQNRPKYQLSTGVMIDEATDCGIKNFEEVSVYARWINMYLDSTITADSVIERSLYDTWIWGKIKGVDLGLTPEHLKYLENQILGDLPREHYMILMKDYKWLKNIDSTRLGYIRTSKEDFLKLNDSFNDNAEYYFMDSKDITLVNLYDVDMIRNDKGEIDISILAKMVNNEW